MTYTLTIPLDACSGMFCLARKLSITMRYPGSFIKTSGLNLSSSYSISTFRLPFCIASIFLEHKREHRFLMTR